MPTKARSRWLRYGLATILPLVVFVVTWKAFDLERAPYFSLFMASVVITSLFGGCGPGVVGTVISSLLAFLVAPPSWTIRLSERGDPLRIGLFTVLGFLISSMVGVVAELQRKLRHETGLLATTLQSIGDAVITTDATARVTFLNDIAQQVTGWTLSEALGRTIDEVFPLIHLYSRKPVLNPVRQVFESGRIEMLANDTLLVRRDGAEILVSDSAAPIRDHHNTIVGVVLVFHDITNVRAEAELERHHLREILANAPAGIGVMRGPEHQWEYVNKEFLRITGRTSETDYLARTVRESLPEIESQPFIGLLNDVYRTGIPYVGCEMKAELKRASDGQLEDVYFDFVYQPLRNINGRVDGILVHAVDVTERVRIKKEIRESEEARRRLATIVECSVDAIIGKDLNGIVTSWNPSAERMFGYTAKEMIGQSITTIIPPEFQHDEQRILTTIARGERIEHFETIRVTKWGERLHVSLTISPVRDEEGSIIGAAKILRDITVQKKAERALHQSERLASVGRLAATVAHEINNPLAAVTNLVYLAKQSSDKADAEQHLRMAEEELSRIAYITKQTLGFYRETKSATAIRLGDLLESAITVASRTRNKGIKIRHEVRNNPEIYGVPGEIRQLFANLLSNSIDAVDRDGRVRIRISAATKLDGKKIDGARIVVADSGHGIPANLRSNLFEPFFTTKNDVGTGLGLWICKSIVEKHGGSIRVKSSTISGRSWTAFSVFLPVLREEEVNQLHSVSA